VLEAFGLKQSVFMPLRHGGKVLGTLEFHSRQEGCFSPERLPLFGSIVDLVAVAVANMLANEEILEREQEKSVLLSISEQLSRIRDKHELLTVTLECLRPIFGLSEAVLSLYDPGLEYVRHYNLAREEKLESVHYRQIVSEAIPLRNGPHQAFMTYPGPRIIDFAQFRLVYPNHPGIKVMEELGLVQSCIMPLRYQDRLLGMLEFHARSQDQLTRHQLSVYRNLADQVAVTVANILADEEILEREREKALLLDISNAIVRIRDSNVLLRFILDKLQPLFGFDDCSISLLDKDHQLAEDLTLSRPGILDSERVKRLRQQGTTSRVAYQGVLSWAAGQIRQGGGIARFHLTDGSIPGWDAYPHASVITQSGLVEWVGTLLQTGGRELGILFLNYAGPGRLTAANLSLLQSITDQVAVALANILANEEILQQKARIEEREREKVMLLSISETIATVRQKGDLLSIISGHLRPIFGFEYSAVALLNEDNTHQAFLLHGF
jgi:GAF domain-containing protein